MKPLLFFLSLLMMASTYAQDLKRIEISGKIVVDSDDIENVTVFNTSSNKGTITDKDGKFKLDVALNDIIEISALQFEEFTVTIDKNILASKKMTVFLVEKINRLDEVVILPYDLTGNLVVDMESVKTFNPDLDAIYFGVADVNSFEFSDDYKSEVENIAVDRQGMNMRYGLNVINVVGVLLKPLFKDKSKQKNEKEIVEMKTNDLRDYYSNRYIIDNFNIPENQVDEFIVYVETNDMDYSLLDKGKEMEFLEHLNQQSKKFLKVKSEKD